MLIVEVVGLIEGIPVDLAERRGVPEVGIEIVGFLIVRPVGGEIAVVVGARIACVIPVECRSGVVDRTESETGVERCALFRFPDPVEDGGGVERFHHFCAAFLAILPSPVGVVER